MNRIILSKPLIDINNTKKLFNTVLKSTFVNEGKQTKKFEELICKFLNVKYAVTTTSGTTAIFLALKAAGIKNNDHVIVPNITFPATANAVKMAGGVPILVDVDPSNLLINEDALKKIITKKSKFIIPVHVSGRGKNIKKIIKICKTNSIKVIEDAAEAFGSKVFGKSLGSFGLTGCFSFAPNKIITTGQGGVVVTNNKKIYKKLRVLKDQGRVGPTSGGEDNYVSLGYNLKFTNLQSSLGLSQIKNIKWRINKLKKIHRFYLKNIKQNNNFKIIKFDLNKGEIPLWTDVWCKNRNKLFKYLKSYKIICRYYWKPLNISPVYFKSFNKFPNSKKLQKKMMWLPSSLNMKINEQRKVCDLINKFYFDNHD